jgi:hypothetical protein
MKKISNLLALIFLASCAIGSGENSAMIVGEKGYFPQLVGIDLEGERRELPKSFDNKINIVAVAFKREQQENVNGWIKVADEIIAKRSDVNFYELPLIYELNPVSRSFINNGMRRGVLGEKARKRTITVYTNREQFFEEMQMKEEKIYLLVIDQEGEILHRIEGDATSENVNSLKKKLKNIRSR